MHHILCKISLVASLFAFTAHHASAATIVWTNLNGGLWSAATNWSPNQVPAGADTAMITNAGMYTITNNATTTITGLTLGDTNSPGTPKLIITAGTFTATNTTVASNGVFFLSAGTVVTAGPADIAGTFNQAGGTWQLNAAANINSYNFTNGELRGANCVITNFNWVGGALNSDAFGNVTTIPIGGTMTISGATAKSMSYYVAPGRTLINNGTATWTGAGISAQCGATINNNGTMTLNGDFGYAWGGTGVAPVFNNTGTLTKASGSGAFTLTSIIVSNGVNGIANIDSGSLALSSCQFYNYGAAAISTGTISFASTSGTNYGALTLGTNSFADFNTGSTYTLDGAVVCPTGDHLRVQGATLTLQTTNLTTPSLLLSSGILNQNTNVVVNTLNQANGTWQLNVPIAINNYNLTNGELRGANCVITNFNWVGGGLNSDALGTTTTIPIGGTLTISGATAKGMSYHVAPGRTLNNNGTATWTGVGISAQCGATINNNGTMTLNGDFGYAWAGTGVAPVFNNNGTLTKASGSGAFTLTSIIVNNNSTANIASGSLAFSSSQFYNNGTVGISNGTISFASSTGTNFGTLNLGASSFADFNAGSTYTLDGTIIVPAADHLRVQGATVTLQTTNLATPTIYLASGILNQNTNVVINTLNQGNGTWQLNVPVAINNYNLTNGELRGANCVITNFNWIAGSLNSDALGNVTTIPVGGTMTISGATTKGMSYYVAPGRTLNNNGTATWTGGGINAQDRATFNNNGSLTLNGDFAYNWAGAGTAPFFNNNGTLTKASGSGAFTLTSIIVNNYNTANINSGSLAFSSSQFHNYGSVTIGNGTISFTSSTGTNHNTLTLGANSFADFNGGTAYTLDGAIIVPTVDHLRVQGATVELATTNLATPSVYIASGQLNQNTNVVVNTINQANGTWRLNLPATINNYNLTNGELRGANVTITNFNWLGGGLNSENAASNTVTIPAGGTLNIGSLTAKTLSDYSATTNGRRLINNGSASWSGANITGYYSPQIVNNNAFNITSDLGYVWSGFGGGPVLVNNNTFTLTSGTDFTLTTASFTNNGTFNIVSGSLTMNGGSGGTVALNNGLLNLDAASFLYCNAGTFNLSGSLISPTANHVQFNGMAVAINTTNLATPSLYETAGTVSQNTNVVVDTYNIAAGTLWPTLPVSFNNLNLTNSELRGANCVVTNLNWLGGSLNAENAASNTVTIPAGGTLNIGSLTAKTLSDYSATTNGRRLINNGSATWSGAGITGSYGAQFVNTATTTLNGDAGLIWSGFGGGPLFLNSGTFTKSAGTGVASFSSTTITNSGAFNVNSGGITVGGNFTQTAGSANLGTNLTANSNIRIEAGTFSGRGAVTGTFYNNGTASAGAPVGLLSAASFTNTGASTWNVELAGTSAGTNYDQLKLTGSATLSGGLNVSFANGFTPLPGNIFTVMTFSARSGVFSSDNVASKGLSIQYSGTNVLLLADNLLPTVVFTSPGDNFNSNCICEPFVLQANASDADGSISNVTFLWNSNLVSVVSNAPYRIVLVGDQPGVQSFSAIARDNRGGETTTNLTVRFYGRGGTNVLNPYLVAADILTNTPVIPKKSIKLCMEGEPGRNYDVEAATDLISSNWNVIGQITLTNNQWIYYDTNATNFTPDRFYRTVRLPRTP